MNIQQLRKAPLWLWALVIAAQIIIAWLFAFWMAPSDALQSIREATGGLISGTLLGNWLVLGIVVAGLLFGLGRQRPEDLGLRLSDLPIGVAVTTIIWLLLNGSEFVHGLISGAQISLQESWAQRGASAVIGGIIAQLLGAALAEEIVFRGFFLRQSAALVTHRNSWMRWGLALIISQMIFALHHIPILITKTNSWDITLGLMPQLFIAGALYALVYMRTSNLFIAVGIHALTNAPTLVVDGGLGLSRYPAYVWACRFSSSGFGPLEDY